MQHWCSGNWHMGMMWFWLLPVIAIAVAAVWLIVRSASRAPSSTPEQILKRRYASGDIDREEYERRLAELRE